MKKTTHAHATASAWGMNTNGGATVAGRVPEMMARTRATVPASRASMIIGESTAMAANAAALSQCLPRRPVGLNSLINYSSPVRRRQVDSGLLEVACSRLRGILHG
jgi:hypothetical protein